MSAQLTLDMPKGTVEATPPDPPDDLVSITSEALVAASYRWAEKKCFALAMWLGELSNAADLDKCPLIIGRTLATELELL